MRDESCPMPRDPELAALALALNRSGHWAELFDDQWRYVYMTDDARRIYDAGSALAPVPLGAHIYSREAVEMRMNYSGGHFTLDVVPRGFEQNGPWLLEAVGRDREALRALVDERLSGLVDEIGEPAGVPGAWEYVLSAIYGGATPLPVEIRCVLQTLRASDGAPNGFALINKPAVGMATLARMTALGDLEHFERMGRVAGADRRPAAILFGDVDSSTPLSRRLSSATYFELGRHLARTADTCVIEAGGVVGRHAGDGSVAFFLAETAGSESAAARSCIEACRALRAAMPQVAVDSGLAAGDLVMRFGLHWGATLYVGQIVTPGRTEVTGLGDEVNETARIEACASGGRALASKALIERLAAEDAAALDLDPAHISYTLLGHLDGATDKARRDAPVIPVCAI